MINKLSRITQNIELAESQKQVLDYTVQQVCQELDVEVCSIFLADYQSNQFILTANRGLNSKCIGLVRADFNEGLVGLVGQREEPINIDSAQNHPAFSHFKELREDEFSAYLGVPIIHQRKVLGVLSIQQREARRFELDEETLLITLAAQMSSMLSDSETDAIISDQQGNRLVRCIHGIPTSGGIAIGQVKVIFPTHDIRHIPKRKTKDIQGEIRRLSKAVKRTHVQLEKMSNRMKGLISDQERSLFEAYQQILGSAGIENEVESEIKSGYWAPFALKKVILNHLKAFQSMDDIYLRERAQDIEDLANRVLGNMLKKSDIDYAQQTNTILVAESVTASMIAEIPLDKITAIVSLKGSSTSHAAILTKALGIPTIMGLDPCQIDRLDQKKVIVDGYKGQIFVSPDDTLIRQYQTLLSEEQQYAEDLSKNQSEANATKDGTPIALMINTNFELSQQVGEQYKGAENNPLKNIDGVGLYRSEMAFMHHEHFPSESHQVDVYKQALNEFGDRPVTIRTLDIGGDKQLPYFAVKEDNPFLGWRGIRVTLDHPEIFLVQLRAIFKASADKTNLQIALPMVATLEELDESYRLINQAYAEIEEELAKTGKTLHRPKIGIILEVPSTIFLLPSFIKRVDFISIGTNDLIQYLLAVDRNNQRLKNFYSHFQPSVLASLDLILKECRNRVPVQVCGEMASDPLAILVLIGLGYRNFSMHQGNVSKIKRTISHFSVDEMQQIADQVMQYETEAKIKSELHKIMEGKSLGGLIRAGS